MYLTSIVLPGLRPIGPFVPTVRVIVCPSPSGERCSFSRVIPAESSPFHWSTGNSFPSMMMAIASMSGAWNNPGISSVIRMRFIVADPVFFTLSEAETCCCLNDLSVSVE